jgi:hypothetical protein
VSQKSCYRSVSTSATRFTPTLTLVCATPFRCSFCCKVHSKPFKLTQPSWFHCSFYHKAHLAHSTFCTHSSRFRCLFYCKVHSKPFTLTLSHSVSQISWFCCFFYHKAHLVHSTFRTHSSQFRCSFYRKVHSKPFELTQQVSLVRFVARFTTKLT